MKAWKDLRKGDTVVCPRDGQEEKVLFARRGNPGKTFVRTSRHDHVADRAAKVETR